MEKYFLNFFKLFKCLVSFGCVFQLISVIEIFSRFEVTTELKVTIPRKFSLPDVTFCFNLIGGINYEKFYRNNQQKVNYIIDQNNEFETLRDLNETKNAIKSGKHSLMLNKFFNTLFRLSSHLFGDPEYEDVHPYVTNIFISDNSLYDKIYENTKKIL